MKVLLFIALMEVSFDLVAPACDVSRFWTSWTAYGNCVVSGTDLCYKEQTRTRDYKHIFAPDDCRHEEQSRRCGQCDYQCSSSDGKCQCKPGHALNQDGTSCSDINECDTNNGGCQQRCSNNIGSFKCSCNDGYSKTNPNSMTSPLCKEKSCGSITPDCPSNAYKDQMGNACKKVTASCSNGVLFNSSCDLSCSAGYDLALINTLSSGIFAEFIRDADFNVNVTTTICKLTASKDVEWEIPKKYRQGLYCRRLNDAPRQLILARNSIKEHQPAGITVGTFSARDEGNEKTIFTIESSDNSFILDGSDLKTTVTFNLRNMATDTVKVRIRATDNNTIPYYTEKEFSIKIENVNDAPTDISISQNTFDDLMNVGDIIGNLTAVDYDTKPAQPSKHFVWTLMDNAKGHFIIQDNSIVLAKKFTDNKDFTSRIVVKVTDKHPSDPKASEKEIYLLHKNLNNPVTITLTNVTRALETDPVNTIYGIIRIIDAENNTVTIKDVSGNDTKAKFSLQNTKCSNGENGTECFVNIVSSGQLDFETRNKYTLTVEATDSNNEQTAKSFTIDVVNVNEAPYLLQFQKISPVYEGSANNALVTSLLVKDVERSSITCKVTDTESSFEMRNLNVVLKTSVNFEEKNRYTLEVECWDDGQLSIKNSTEIFIEDKNEIPGSPCLHLSNVKINHTSPLGTKVMTFTSYDADNEFLQKQKLSYALDNSQVPFKVENEQLLVNGKLTPNMIYKVGVSVSDDGVLKRYENGVLKSYTGTPAQKSYTCDVSTYALNPCKDFQEYRDFQCVCPNGLSGSNCDRNRTRCNDAQCSNGEICSEFIKSPEMCIGNDYQLPMLLKIKSRSISTEESQGHLEKYIKDILEGNFEGKSLQNLQGNKRRKRRSVKASYYVEGIDPINVRSIYTYIKFIPYNINNNYKMSSASELCPLFDGTDVRCVNKNDCEILKTAGHGECAREFGEIESTPVSNNNNNGTPSYVFVIIALVGILIVVVVAVLYIRRSRKPIEKETNVMFNNDTSTIPDFSSGGNQTMRDIHRLRQITDLETFENEVFTNNRHENKFEVANAAYGLHHNVNYRENKVFLEDNNKLALNEKGDELSPPKGTADHLYASIGRAAKNPLYQSSVKDSSKGEKTVDETTVEIPPDVLLQDQEKTNNKEYAFIDDIPELKDIRNSHNLNEYNPNDDEVNYKTNTKTTLTATPPTQSTTSETTISFAAAAKTIPLDNDSEC